MANKKRKKKNGGKMKPAYAGGLTPDMASSLAQIVPGLIGAIPRTQAPGAGGDLQGLSSAMGAAGSIASLLPGAGTAIGAGLNVLSSVAGEINLPSAYVPMGENQGKYSRAYGGSLQPLASNAYEVKGNNPSVTDGVELPNAFVDHGETISGDYVFSEERTNPLTGKTFAKDAKKIAKAKGKAEALPYDPAAKNTAKYLGEQEQQLANLQETINGLLGEADKFKKGSYKNGGKIKPAYQNGPTNPLEQFAKERVQSALWQGAPVSDEQAQYEYNNVQNLLPMLDPTGYFGRAQVPTAAAPGNNPLTATVNNLGGGTPATTAGKGKRRNPYAAIKDPNYIMDIPDSQIGMDLAWMDSSPLASIQSGFERQKAAAGTYEDRLAAQLARKPSEDLPQRTILDPPDRGGFAGQSEGERLQMMEAMAKAGMLLQGYDRQPLYQNNAAITRQQFDPQNALMQQQYAANAARQGLQNSGSGASLQSNLQNLAANQMRAAGQTQTQYDQMNKQARTQYEQRLGQRQQENIGYKYATDQVRQQDESAYWNQFRDVVTGIGNKGREMVAQDENQRAAEMLVAAYPDIAPFLESWGIKINKKSKTKK